MPDSSASRKRRLKNRFYRVRTIGPIMVVENLMPPRMRIFIRIDRNLPEIIKITLLDKCTPRDIARNIRRLSCFLLKIWGKV